MADLPLKMANASGRLPGRTPITKAGIVVYNGFKDDKEIAARRKNRNNALYRAPVDDAHVSIYEHEICIGKKRTTVRRSVVYNETDQLVLSSVNGAFEPPASGVPPYLHLAALESAHQFRGIANTRSAHDSTGKHSEVDVTLQLGGLDTIPNTGPYRINTGDPVMWQLPDPRAPVVNGQGLGDRPADKLLIWTVPYDPATQSATLVSALRDTIRAEQHGTLRSVGTDYELFKKQPIVQASRALEHALLNIAVAAVHTALFGGLFDQLPAVKSADYQANADVRRGALVQVREFFGLPKVNNAKLLEDGLGAAAIVAGTGAAADGVSDPTSALQPGGAANAKKTSVREFFTETVLASPGSRHQMMSVTAGNALPADRTIVHDQTVAIEHLLRSIATADASYKNRIIGRAMSSANPGSEFDILIGSYMN